MRFTAFLCLFALLASAGAAFPIKTRDEQGPSVANVEKTTLYDMIFGRSKVQKPTSKASGHPAHNGIRFHRQRTPTRNTVHVHRREHENPREHVDRETK